MSIVGRFVSKVFIRGLHNRQDINGRAGELLDILESSKKCKVKLDGDGAIICVASDKVYINQTSATVEFIHKVLENFDSQNYAFLAESADSIKSCALSVANRRPQEATQLLRKLSISYLSVGSFQKSLDIENECRGIAERTNDILEQGRVFGQMGLAYVSLGNNKDALDMQEKSLKIFAESNDEFSIGQINGNIGNIHQRMGDFEKALYHHELHLKTAEKLKHIQDQCKALGNIGNTLLLKGSFREAIEKHSKRLQLSITAGDKAAQGRALSSLATVYQSKSEFGRAIKLHEEAVSIAEQVLDPVTHAGSLSNLGNIWGTIGRFGKGLRFYEEALQIYKEIEDLEGQGRVCGNMGGIYCLFGDYSRAQSLHQRFYEIVLQSPNKPALARACGGLGSTLSAAGHLTEALAFHQQDAHLSRDCKDEAGEATAMVQLANVQCDLGLDEEAEPIYCRALEIAKRINMTDLCSRAESALGALRLRAGRAAEAVRFLEDAVADCERTHASLGARDTDRNALLDLQRECYANLQIALLRSGASKQAFVVSESGKACSLKNLMDRHFAQYSAIAPNLQDVTKESEWCSPSSGDLDTHMRNGDQLDWECLSGLAREEGGAFVLEYSLLKDDQVAAFLLDPSGQLCHHSELKLPMSGHTAPNLRQRGSTLSRSGSIRVLLAQLRCGLGVDDNHDSSAHQQFGADSAVRRARKDRFKSLLIRKRSQNADAGQTESPMQGVFDADEEDCLDDQELLDELNLEISEDEDVQCWLRSILNDEDEPVRSAAKAVLEMHSPPKSWQQLNSLHRGYLHDHHAYVSRGTDMLLRKVRELLEPEHILKQLYTLLIAPLRHALPPAGSDLLIIPDVDLYGIPWAALMNEYEQPLIEHYSIRIAPSLIIARRASARKEAARNRKFLIVGNPWPLSSKYNGFRSLKHAKDEALQIAHQLKSSSVLKSNPDEILSLVERNATKHKVETALQNADLVHFACHGWIDRLALVLCSAGTPPSVSDDSLLCAAEIQRDVHLAAGSTVVLSACDTGRGLVYGEGVVGLARAFLAAGAGATVVSLWSLRDQSTRLMMEAFYSAMDQGFHAPQALRFAMLMMQRNDFGVASWAGFIPLGASTTLISEPFIPSAEVDHSGGAIEYSRWNVDEVKEWLCRSGLSELATTFGDNMVDGRTLADWAGLDEAEFKKRLKEDLEVSAVRLRTNACKELRNLVAAAQAASGSSSRIRDSSEPLDWAVRKPSDFDILVMEAGLEMRCPDWFERAQKLSYGDSESDDEKRNWKPLAENFKDLGSHAGNHEKEALRALKFNLMLDGKEIGDEGHGLSSSGMLTTSALACLGLRSKEGYKNLWGRNGMAVKRAREQLETPLDSSTRASLETAVQHLQSSVLFRHKDMLKKDSIAPEMKAAFKECAHFARSLSCNDVMIFGAFDHDWESVPCVHVPFQIQLPQGVALHQAIERFSAASFVELFSDTLKKRFSGIEERRHSKQRGHAAVAGMSLPLDSRTASADGPCERESSARTFTEVSDALEILLPSVLLRPTPFDPGHLASTYSFADASPALQALIFEAHCDGRLAPDSEPGDPPRPGSDGAAARDKVAGVVVLRGSVRSAVELSKILSDEKQKVGIGHMHILRQICAAIQEMVELCKGPEDGVGHHGATAAS